MGGKYKRISEGVSSSVSSLRRLLQDYDNSIVDLNALIDSIELSTDWRDAKVKNSFIMSASSYIDSFNGLITMMERYINYLDEKNNCGDNLESAFSKG